MDEVLFIVSQVCPLDTRGKTSFCFVCGMALVNPLLEECSECYRKKSMKSTLKVGLLFCSNQKQWSMVIVIFTGGVKVTCDGVLVDCLVGVTKVTADTVGKASLTNQTQFNGQFGCCHCLAEGHNVTTTKGGNIRSYSASVGKVEKRRTHERILRHARKAVRSGEKVFSAIHIKFGLLNKSK